MHKLEPRKDVLSPVISKAMSPKRAPRDIGVCRIGYVGCSSFMSSLINFIYSLFLCPFAFIFNYYYNIIC